MGEGFLKEEEIKEENGSPYNPVGASSPSPLEKLTEKKDRRYLFLHGKKTVSSIMVLYFRENGLGRPRYAIYTSKRLGGAIARNRIKRIFREVLNRNKRDLQGYDFIIIPREAAKDLRGQGREGGGIEKIFINHGILTG